MTAPRQTNSQDETHLDNLSVGHYVVGGLIALFACLPLLYFVIGLSLVMGGDSIMGEGGKEPPAAFGWIFAALGLALFLFGQAIALSLVLSGRFIKQRKNYLFSFILACIACAFVPLGTILGVFTILVLSRDSVKNAYGRT